MKKRLVMPLVVFFVVTLSTNSLAQSISDLQKKRENIKTDTQDTKQKLSETKERKSSVETEVENIDIELNKATEELEIITVQLDKTAELLDQTEKELNKAETDRESQYEVFKDRIRFMYEHGKTGYLEIALQAKSFTDFLNRVDNINRIVKYDQNIITRLLETEAVISTKVNEIERQKETIEVLLYEQTQKTNNLEYTLAKKKELMIALNANEQKYLQQLNDLEKTDKEIEALIKSQQEELKAAAARNKGSLNGSIQTVPYTGGKLGWPVPSHGKVSSGYSFRTSPKREFHAGIDIPAPTGTAVVAAESGVVIYAGSFGGYGIAVIVDHGNGLSTLYGHNSKLLVSVGQSVSRGESIAKAGSTGFSTGPHCHFEVRVNGAHTNPWNYLS